MTVALATSPVPATTTATAAATTAATTTPTTNPAVAVNIALAAASIAAAVLNRYCSHPSQVSLIINRFFPTMMADLIGIPHLLRLVQVL